MTRAAARGLAACAALGDEGNGVFANVVVFHSLSKRSSVPGIRSGFVAGDPALIGDFRKLRSFAGASVGLPLFSKLNRRINRHIYVTRPLMAAQIGFAHFVARGQFGRGAFHENFADFDHVGPVGGLRAMPAFCSTSRIVVPAWAISRIT